MNVDMFIFTPMAEAMLDKVQGTYVSLRLANGQPKHPAMATGMRTTKMKWDAKAEVTV